MSRPRSSLLRRQLVANILNWRVSDPAVVYAHGRTHRPFVCSSMARTPGRNWPEAFYTVQYKVS